MSKNLLYLMTGRAICALTVILLMCFISSCSDEVERFKADISPSSFSFKPITGGAIMYYRMPDDPSIVGVHARYKDAYGKEVLHTGSHLCDSMELTGFNEAMQNVKVLISVFQQDGTESEPVETTFNTYDSGPVAFMKSAEVMSNWDGFSVKYEAPERTKGMVHVFYLGTDPLTGDPDTILVNSFNLDETKEPEIKSFSIKQDVKKPVVVLKVEDYRGNMVAQQTYEGVECMEKAKLDPKNFTFYCDNAIVDTMGTLGYVSPTFLFDGDTKGMVNWEVAGMATKVHSFIAGPEASGPNAHPMYMDLQSNRVVGSVRIYSVLYSSQGPIWIIFGIRPMLMFYDDTAGYPCDIDIYLAKDDGDNTSLSTKDMNKLEWKKVANFKQDKNLPHEQRWCSHTRVSQNEPSFTSLEEMQAADPDYADILIPAEGQKDGYRYIKMVINDNFETVSGNLAITSWKGYVTFNELEVYTKKEE